MGARPGDAHRAQPLVQLAGGAFLPPDCDQRDAEQSERAAPGRAADLPGPLRPEYEREPDAPWLCHGEPVGGGGCPLLPQLASAPSDGAGGDGLSKVGREPGLRVWTQGRDGGRRLRAGVGGVGRAAGGPALGRQQAPSARHEEGAHAARGPARCGRALRKLQVQAHLPRPGHRYRRADPQALPAAALPEGDGPRGLRRGLWHRATVHPARPRTPSPPSHPDWPRLSAASTLCHPAPSPHSAPCAPRPAANTRASHPFLLPLFVQVQRLHVRLRAQPRAQRAARQGAGQAARARRGRAHLQEGGLHELHAAAVRHGQAGRPRAGTHHSRTQPPLPQPPTPRLPPLTHPHPSPPPLTRHHPSLSPLTRPPLTRR